MAKNESQYTNIGRIYLGRFNFIQYCSVIDWYRYDRAVCYRSCTTNRKKFKYDPDNQTQVMINNLLYFKQQNG